MSPESYSCTLCDVNFTDHSALGDHFLAMHVGDRHAMDVQEQDEEEEKYEENENENEEEEKQNPFNHKKKPKPARQKRMH